MEPIKIVTWACPICKTEYEEKKNAIACLSQPEVTPNYKEGDIVYLTERFPRDANKPFLKRKIVEVGRVTVDRLKVHEIEYELNEPVEIGDGYYVGRVVSWSYDDVYRLAHEDDFVRMGDPYYWDESIIVSPETVANWEEVL